MAKYLLEANYTQAGVQGVVKEGGSGRRDAIAKMLADIGGSLDAFYFAFGPDDVYVIADIPDHVSAAAISLAVGAAGGATVRTIVLLTPEEIDRAAQQSIAYRPPGS
jgi:uncharacterized protein with GYD domain